MKVYFSIETEIVGEFEGKLIEGTLEELKRSANQWDKKAYGYTYNTDTNEPHYVEVELYEGSKEDFKELEKYIDDL